VTSYGFQRDATLVRSLARAQGCWQQPQLGNGLITQRTLSVVCGVAVLAFAVYRALAAAVAQARRARKVERAWCSGEENGSDANTEGGLGPARCLVLGAR
jgi:hypothetical protein